MPYNTLPTDTKNASADSTIATTSLTGVAGELDASFCASTAGFSYCFGESLAYENWRPAQRNMITKPDLNENVPRLAVNRRVDIVVSPSTLGKGFGVEEHEERIRELFPR